MEIEERLQELREGQVEVSKTLGDVSDKLGGVTTTVGLIKQKCSVCSDAIERHNIQLNGDGARGGVIAEIQAIKATSKALHGCDDKDNEKWYQSQLGKVIEKALYLVVVITGMAGAYLFGSRSEVSTGHSQNVESQTPP